MSRRLMIRTTVTAVTVICMACMALPAAAQFSQNVQFPAGGGQINVRDLGAKGDGVTDDTAAFKAAIAWDHDDTRFIYVPDGTYLLSDTLGWTRRRTLMGQSRDGVVLKLKDRCPGFTDPANPRPFIHAAIPGEYYGQDSWVNAAFGNYIQNLTVDTGTGNPGATAVRWTTHNDGMVENVIIRSGDGQGVIGLDLSQTEFGPGLVSHVEIDGFDTGIATPAQVSNAVMDTIALRHQNVVGIRNEHATAIRRLRSENRVPAIRHGQRGGHLVLIDAELLGGAPDVVAIEARGQYYLRNVRAEGYHAALSHDGQVRPGLSIDEYLSGEPHIVGPGPAASLNLPVQDPPAVFEEPIDQWRVVKPAGNNHDDTLTLQQAMDSGAATIFLTGGSYTLSDTLRVPASVRRILSVRGASLKGTREQFGIGSLTQPVVEGYGGGKPMLRLEGRTDEPLAIERLSVGAWPHRVYQVEIATPRPVLIRHGIGGHPGGEVRTANGSAGGTLFLVETSTDLRIARDYRVFAWQYNPENNPFQVNEAGTMKQRTYVVNDGGQVWVLGFKTEAPAIHAVTRNGGQTEILGGFFRDHFGASVGLGKDGIGQEVPYFIVDNAALSAMYVQFAYRKGAARALQLVARQNGREQKVKLGDGSLIMPLLRADVRPRPQTQR